jgi:type VI secretion system secreted protein VgrG
MPITQANRPVAVATPLGEDELVLRRAEVREALSEPFAIWLDLQSENFQVAFDRIIGETMTVRIELGDGATRYYNGIVTDFAQSGSDGSLAEYQATLRPWLWALTLNRNSRIFQLKSVPDIVEEILKDHGFTDLVKRLTGTYAVREYCVQYQESDFAFLSRLLENEGIYYFFEHRNGSHRLVLCDGIGGHEPVAGFERFIYRPPGGNVGDQDIDVVTEWRVARQVQPGRYVLSDFNFAKPRSDLQVRLNAKAHQALGSMEVYEHPGGYGTTAEGEAYVRTRLEEAQAAFERVTGSGNMRTLTVGSLVSITEHPRADQNREYLVVATNYSFASAGYSSGQGDLSDQHQCSFSLMESRRPFRPARQTPRPVVRGPQTALVTGPAGEEIHTNEHGQVKVQFHWDRDSRADDNSSCWIRVAQNWAGRRWGAMFLPRVGQEVIVDFIEGDPDRPIITGRVYNGDAPPPHALPDNKTVSGIRTSSSKGSNGYNEIRFEDKSGAEQVFVHAQKDFESRTKNDAVEWVGSDRHLIVIKDQLEKVGGDLHLTVQGDRNEKIGGALSQTIATELHVKTGLSAAVAAGTEIHLKAGMNMVIEAGVSLTLKAGGAFIVIGPTGVTVSGIPVMINSGGSAGSGAGAAPEAPQQPREAADGEPGEADRRAEATAAAEDETQTLKPHPVADMMRSASEYAAPFHERVEA